MRTIIPVFFSLLLFSSCGPSKILPIKGSYPATPMEFQSSKNFDEVWDKLIDVFAQKGLSIKIIDRSSGLIVSEKSILPATIEKKDGTLVNPDAFIVVAKRHNTGANRDEPITGTKTGPYASVVDANPVYGEWNVRIKKSGSGTIINVNITNLTYDTYNAYTKSNNATPLTLYKSTGVFEKLFSDLIK